MPANGPAHSDILFENGKRLTNQTVQAGLLPAALQRPEEIDSRRTGRRQLIGQPLNTSLKFIFLKMLRASCQSQRGRTSDRGRSPHRQPLDGGGNFIDIVEFKIDQVLRQQGLIDDPQFAGKQFHPLFHARKNLSFGRQPSYGFQHREVPFLFKSRYTIPQSTQEGKGEMMEQKQAVADCMNRLYARGLTTTSGGNISLRISEQRILLTPSATDKGNMRADQIAEIGLDGTNHTPHLKPSGETQMHLEIYKRRPDILAIVHAHPPMASVYAVTERPLNVRLIAESYAVLGEPATAPYALTGTDELATYVADCLTDEAVCVIMRNHGVLTVGSTLLEAFDRMEVLENTAKINLHVHQLGSIQELNDEQCAALAAWAGRNG